MPSLPPCRAGQSQVRTSWRISHASTHCAWWRRGLEGVQCASLLTQCDNKHTYDVANFTGLLYHCTLLFFFQQNKLFFFSLYKKVRYSSHFSACMFLCVCACMCACCVCALLCTFFTSVLGAMQCVCVCVCVCMLCVRTLMYFLYVSV